MSDRPEPTAPEGAAIPVSTAPARRFHLDPAVLMLGIAGLVLVVVLGFLWRQPAVQGGSYVDPDRVEALETRVRQLGNLEPLAGRVQELEARSRELAALQERVQRLAVLDDRVRALEPLAQRVQQLQGLGDQVQQLAGLPDRVQQQIAAATAPLADRLQQLAAQAAPLADRLQALEARPAPDLAPLQSGLADLGRRLEAQDQTLRNLAARPAFDPAAVASREALDRLSQRADGLSAQMQALQAEQGRRLDAAERGTGERLAAIERGLTERVATLERTLGERVAGAETGAQQRVAALDTSLQGRIAALETALGQRVATAESGLGARLGALEQAQQRLAAVEGRAARLAAVDSVRALLEAGRPLAPALRNVPDAPAPLARFANAAPPTEASLRLAFDEHARAARAASDPGAQQQGVLDSALSRLSGLVTVRRGDQVVFGDAAAAEIEASRRALEAGDLDASLVPLRKLPPAAQEAMRPWVEQVQALIAARAALRQMAAG
ncbi:hypothetical protein M0638_12850 [Roseomonas sp. NAR14]|uniref:Uncharacterized protein n=1 Tax=Roseomonas acroporae TaxID=2937791 RepID=A0A9X1Y788_9PROT|nr:hypothetical protein [Roseomonas acroporae]MCK8785274.1 hypothetical protein [Roseomonas acroporae]